MTEFTQHEAATERFELDASVMSTPGSPSTGNYSNGSQDDHWQMKDCMAKQKSQNAGLSQDQLTQCRKQRPRPKAGQ